MKRGKVGILLSGRGSNFLAIHKNSIKKESNFEISVVISNKKNARGLLKARELKIPAYYVSKKGKTKQEYEREIINILKKHKVELVCLAGYMRLLGEEIINEFKNRIMNIHPSLLPSFKGLDAQKQAIEYGVKISGCTVHFVDNGLDSGPIIIQKAVEVKDNDDEESLSNRILKEEHKIYSKAIKLFFDNKLEIRGRRVVIK